MKKRILLSGLITLTVASMFLSCSTFSHASKQKTYVDMLAERVPIKLTEEQRVFVNDNNAFTLRFLNMVNEADQSGRSFIYSPLSITYVLSMVNDAATGKAEQELEQTLGFHQGGIQAVNEYCKTLIENLPKADKKVEVNIANAIFLNKNYTLKDQFKQDMQEYYAARAEALDFSSSNTLGQINSWCRKKTNGMIPSILDKVEPVMVSYLLNAIYFKAEWNKKFSPENTKTETFTTRNGSAQIPMMHQNVLIYYAKNDTYAAVEIPYGNKLWNMTVMLPEEGKTTDDIIRQLAQAAKGDGTLTPLMSNVRAHKVDLKLPRFETSSDTENMEEGLVGLLEKMGIRQAFDSNCTEITNMCETPVFINMIRQKAKIIVNEKGTEAAAVTGSGMLGGAAVDLTPRAVFHANRPFVYVIRESSSGVILFVGKFTGE